MTILDSFVFGRVLRPLLGLASVIWLFALVIAQGILGVNSGDTIATWPCDIGKNGGFPHVGLLLFGLYFFVNLLGLPVGCLLGIRWANDRISAKILFGTTAGSIWGLWLGSLLLTVPYLGAYPSVPAIFAEMVLRHYFGMPDAGQGSPLSLIAADVVIWGCFGCIVALAYRIANAPRRPLNVAPRSKDSH
jgi:hypothetical protein